MDIAAGNGRGSNSPGVAPQADLIFVEVAASDIPWSGPAVVGKAFGDSVPKGTPPSRCPRWCPPFPRTWTTVLACASPWPMPPV